MRALHAPVAKAEEAELGFSQRSDGAWGRTPFKKERFIMKFATVKHALATVTAVAMAFGALAFMPTQVNAAQVFYDLSQCEELAEQEPGYIMGENIYPAEWVQAGGGMTHEIIEAPRGHNGIRQFNRPQNWNGMDFQADNVPGVNFATDDFVIFIAGRVDPDMENFAIQSADNPWPHIVPITEFGPNGEFSVLVTSTQYAMRNHDSFVESNPAAGQFSPLAFQRFIRINPVGHQGEFSLFEFIVAAPGWTPDFTTDFVVFGPAPGGAAPATAPAGAEGVLTFTVGSTTYTANGVAGTLDAAPFNADGRVMVPLRQIGEAINADTIAFEDNTAIIVAGDVRIELPIGVEIAGGMGTPVIVEGRTFVPLGYIAGRIGATPRWDGAANTAFIYLD